MNSLRQKARVMSKKIVEILLKEHINALVEKGMRRDGRGLYNYRDIEIKSETATHGDGECWVKIGKTQVVTGIKVDVGPPYPDTPDKGVFVVNVELLPLASPTFEPGPPGPESIEIARVVDRTIRSAEAIDLEKLVIKPGELVYILFVDIYVLDYDGNLFDAATLSAVSALSKTTIPVVRVDDNGNIIANPDEKFRLELKSKPVTVTMVKIGKELVVDPNLEEEQVADSRITFGVKEGGKICSIQKGPGSLSIEMVMKAAEIALNEYEQLSAYYR